jgi:type IV pilus assembly protein PilM
MKLQLPDALRNLQLPKLPNLSALSKLLKIPGFRTRSSLLGLDVGHRNVKGVQLSRHGNRVILDRYYFQDLAGIFPKFPKERDSAQVIKALAEIHKLAGTKTSTALSDEQVLNYDLSLPALPVSEMRVAVEYEVGNLSPIPESELTVDYWEESKGGRIEGTNLKVKAFAARRSIVDEHLDHLTAAGFKPLSIESRMLANIEALRFNEYIQPLSQYVVVDIGDSQTSIGFVRNGTLVSCRIEKVGSGAINEQLSARYGTDFMRAETLKASYRVGGGSTSNAENEVLEEVYLRIFKSIKDSIDGHVENTVGTRIDSILLVGGGSRIQGVDEALSGLFEIPAIQANPFKKIQIYADEKSAADDQIGALAPHMATAVGLALRSIA